MKLSQWANKMPKGLSVRDLFIEDENGNLVFSKERLDAEVKKHYG